MPLYIYMQSCHVIALSSTNYDIKFIVHNKLESYIHRYESIMNIISTKDFYGYWWYVVHFAAFPFEFYFSLLILSCSITVVQLLRLDYCENFELAWKETIDKSKSNMSCF